MKKNNQNQNGSRTVKSAIKIILLLICLYVGMHYSGAAPDSQKENGQQDVQSTEETASAGKAQGEESPGKTTGIAQQGSADSSETVDSAEITGAGGRIYAENEPSKSLVCTNPEMIPDYDGEDVITLNDNVPEFTEYDLENIEGQHFSDLDELGRCGVAYAMLDESMMPTGKRGDIYMIHPTGWHSVTYSAVTSEDQHLYNRSHLLAYSLTGQNDNEKNLITGTQHLNQEVMLPYENEVVWYLEDSGNHVLYRVTPYFAGDELVARGVEMEAYSVEDSGEGVEYHIFIYNVQPGVEIDYATGESWESEDGEEALDSAA